MMTSPRNARRCPRRIRSTMFACTAAVVLGVITLPLIGGCSSTESHRRVEGPTVRSSNYSGPRQPIALGKIADRTPRAGGVFADGNSKLGPQTREILLNHLTQSNHFDVLNRQNLEEMKRESGFSGAPIKVAGAKFLITGAITEFGRREEGGVALGGILGKSKKQLAYAKVSLTVVDVTTSRTVTAAQGAGEYELNNKEVLGFGTRAGYDATLADKVINLAIVDAVDKLAASVEAGWK